MKLTLLLLALLLVIAQHAITQTNEQTNKLTIEQAKTKLQQLQDKLDNIDKEIDNELDVAINKQVSTAPKE